MGWQKNLSNIRNYINAIFERFGTNSFRLKDSGIFDPFIPITSLRNVKGDYQTDVFSSLEGEPLSDNPTSINRQFIGTKLILGVIIVILGGRLMFLQVTNGQEFSLLAEGNRFRSRAIPAPRGLIYDRNGVPLVRNEPNFSVIVYTTDLPRAENERKEVITKISQAVAIDENTLNELVRKNIKQKSFSLLEGLSRERALSYEVKLFGVEGVELVKTPTRVYSDMPSLGSLIGYTGKVDMDDLDSRPNLLITDFVGKTGLEKQYDELLQGTHGQETLEVDSQGKTVRSIGENPPVAGHSLILSLDSRLQEIAAKGLAESMVKSQAKSGAAVAVDTRTGEILAIVSLPTYDNNLFSSAFSDEARKAIFNDSNAPLINRAIAGQYPSGSTIKPVVAVTGLESGVINQSTKIDTSAGKIEIGQWTFPDWKIHGTSDIRQAIAESNNIFFYAVGGGYKQITGLGAERLAKGLQKFGFGKVTGIDIPGEKAGLVPTPDWKKKVKKESWYIGDTYNLAIGQGDLLVTPLQLARSTASIANGGTLLQPHLLTKVINTNGSIGEEIGVKIEEQNLANPSSLQVVREGMRRAVESGSARSFLNLPVQVAAKTGTAQFDLAKEKTHSWFTAFAPYQNPEIALAVIVEGGGEGYVVAAPVAKNILEQYFKLPLTPINPADHL